MRRKFTWKPYSISKEGYNAYELYVNKKYFGVLYESKILEKSSIFEIDNQSGGSSSPGSYDRPIIIFFKTVNDTKILYKEVVNYMKKNFYHLFP